MASCGALPLFLSIEPHLLYLEIHAAPWAPCKLEPLLIALY